MTGADGRQAARTRAGADGGYAVPGLRPGTYTLIVTAPGFQPEAAAVTLNGSGAVRDFVVSGGGTVTGIVRRSPGGSGAGDTAVVATDGDGQVLARTRTRADGTFQLAGLPAGEITVTAHLDGHRPAAATVAVSGTEPAVADLLVQAAGTLRGTVTGPDERPVPGARVTVSTAAGELAATAVTDEHGDYLVAGLAPGDYTVVTSLFEPVVRQVDLGGGETATVDADLRAGRPEQARS
ncbi:carboxypeptidase-like regulatory domain-containing protein [Amycolatopsis thermalba]|uniref:Carboxypeptidase-like regulatory domain-containing protein n=1 Tax=Amycolatopsis thermalba TaxID=944492 RepID=A0ABY4P6I0_9PSEU|nr:carboxypeptidase-like regulatory domain-containing protein [Amycolatopsis thermalba]